MWESKSHQWGRTGSSKLDSHKFRQLVFDKGSKKHNGIKTVLSTGHPEADLKPLTDMNSTWIANLSIKYHASNSWRQCRRKPRWPWVGHRAPEGQSVKDVVIIGACESTLCPAGALTEGENEPQAGGQVCGRHEGSTDEAGKELSRLGNSIKNSSLFKTRTKLGSDGAHL